MGYRYLDTHERHGVAGFCTIEVVALRKSDRGECRISTQTLLVDNHGETLRFVREHMGQMAARVVQVKRLDALERARVDESARLFEQNLAPLFSLIATRSERMLGALSASLKKALILMAMDRYGNDPESVCLVLGISRERLDSELSACEIARHTEHT
jgi:hypothetical protein